MEEKHIKKVKPKKEKKAQPGGNGEGCVPVR